MYLSDMLETLTILRDSGKLMDSARVFFEGFEVDTIESNGFDIILRAEDFPKDIIPEKHSDTISSHVRETNAALDAFERNNNGNQENNEKNA